MSHLYYKFNIFSGINRCETLTQLLDIKLNNNLFTKRIYFKITDFFDFLI